MTFLLNLNRPKMEITFFSKHIQSTFAFHSCSKSVFHQGTGGFHSPWHNYLSKTSSWRLYPWWWKSGSNYPHPLAFEVMLISTLHWYENQNNFRLWIWMFNAHWIYSVLDKVAAYTPKYGFKRMHFWLNAQICFA